MMYATVSPSEIHDGYAGTLAGGDVSSIRACGSLRISSVARSGRSVRGDVYEAGGLRIRFPNEAGPGLSAVAINTGGGVTGGDRLDISATAGAGSVLTVTTSAAEKMYRSAGEAAEMHIALSVRERASLAWLPQEAILFDGARIRRIYEVDVAQGAHLLLCDVNCVGRTAMNENVGRLFLQDQWRIRIGGQLCYADYMRIDGDASQILARPFVAGGACSFASIIVCGNESAAACKDLRNLFANQDEVHAGAGLFSDICIARLVSSRLGPLRDIMVRALQHLYGAAVPRSWAT